MIIRLLVLHYGRKPLRLSLASNHDGRMDGSSGSTGMPLDSQLLGTGYSVWGVSVYMPPAFTPFLCGFLGASW